MLTLKALLEATMDTNQKLQDRVKYMENKCTKAKKKIILEDEIVDISSDDDKDDEASRTAKEPTLSMLAYEEITGIKPRVVKPSIELKDATKYAKIRDLPIRNGKDHK